MNILYVTINGIINGAEEVSNYIIEDIIRNAKKITDTEYNFDTAILYSNGFGSMKYINSTDNTINTSRNSIILSISSPNLIVSATQVLFGTNDFIIKLIKAHGIFKDRFSIQCSMRLELAQSLLDTSILKGIYGSEYDLTYLINRITKETESSIKIDRVLYETTAEILIKSK